MIGAPTRPFIEQLRDEPLTEYIATFHRKTNPSRGPKPRGSLRVCETCKSLYYRRPYVLNTYACRWCGWSCMVQSGEMFQWSSKGGLTWDGRLHRKQIKQISLPPPPEYWPFIPVGNSEDSEIIRVVHKAVPANLPKHVREDVCQDMVLAILEGRLAQDSALSQASLFVKDYFREYGHLAVLSLDAPINGKDGDTYTLADTITDRHSLWKEAP